MKIHHYTFFEPALAAIISLLLVMSSFTQASNQCLDFVSKSSSESQVESLIESNCHEQEIQSSVKSELTKDHCQLSTSCDIACALSASIYSENLNMLLNERISSESYLIFFSLLLPSYQSRLDRPPAHYA